MAVATFDAAAFKARYPEFTAASNASLSYCFDDAGLYLANTDASPVQDISRRTRLLWMLTAHIATLGGALSADGKPLPVGRVSQAAEGSVSASFDFTPATPGSGAWFAQTAYGAMFWQATVNLRGMRYVSNPTVW
jgi:hypothetical protein